MKTAAPRSVQIPGGLRQFHPLDIVRLQPFFAGDDLEADGVALVQGFVSQPDDGRMMHEHVLAGVLGDKPEAFFVVKPLHFAACHNDSQISGMLRKKNEHNCKCGCTRKSISETAHASIPRE
jgi:hypothetical protein